MKPGQFHDSLNNSLIEGPHFMNLTGTTCLLCSLDLHSLQTSKSGLSAKPQMPDNQKCNLAELIFLVFVRQGKLHFLVIETFSETGCVTWIFQSCGCTGNKILLLFPLLDKIKPKMPDGCASSLLSCLWWYWSKHILLTLRRWSSPGPSHL